MKAGETTEDAHLIVSIAPWLSGTPLLPVSAYQGCGTCHGGSVRSVVAARLGGCGAGSLPDSDALAVLWQHSTVRCGRGSLRRDVDPPASTWEGTRHSVRYFRRRPKIDEFRVVPGGKQARRARGVISMTDGGPFEAGDDQDVTFCRDAGSETIDAEESADEYTIDEEVTV